MYYVTSQFPKKAKYIDFFYSTGGIKFKSVEKLPEIHPKVFLK
jgi:hypothetical protein